MSYIILEAGTWQLSGGTTIEVGTISDLGTSASITNFNNAFSSTPAVLSQLQTNNNAVDLLYTRHSSTSNSQFNAFLETGDVTGINLANAEQVGYVAMDQTSGTWGGANFISSSTANSITHNTSNLSFDFGSIPKFFAQVTTLDGGG